MVGTGGVTNNGTLIASNANPETLTGNITGSGPLYQNGVGPLILTGNNTGDAPAPSPSPWAISSRAGNGVIGTLGSGPIIINGTLVLDPGGAETIGAVSGSGGITNLAGTTTLSGIDTYAGLTAISSGTLRVGSAGALPSTTTVVLNKQCATLSWHPGFEWIQSIREPRLRQSTNTGNGYPPG